jgi:translation initiation factor IF-2
MVDKTKNTTEKTARPPIVTVMGHVDHGKTSILDALRKTRVQAGEYGGITQHIGAYQIEHNSQKITFIDTPGHAAFTQMRSRGGKTADIVVLVVAADEGVKPQTKEAIAHAKAAGVPIIVAINKMDRAGADPKKVKQELSQENVLVEDWGGEVVSVEVSATEGKNLTGLLDAILVVAEVLEIEANSDEELEAVIVESRLDRRKGVVVSCIVRNGTIKLGDDVVASGFTGRVKALSDDKGKGLKSAGPATPVEILGFKKVPNVGDLVVYCGSELAEIACDEDRVEIIGQEVKNTIALVLKADTQGTLEAVKQSLADLVSSSVGASFALKFLHSATGDVTESDVMLAQSTRGLVIGFDVKAPPNVLDFAESQKVTVKTYRAIYELIEDAEKLLEGTALEEEQKIKGRAQVIKLFKLPSGDVVAGSKVLAGSLKPKNRVAIYDKDPADVTEDDEPLYRGSIKKLKIGQGDVSVVGKDVECGVLLKPEFEDLEKEHWIEVI